MNRICAVSFLVLFGFVVTVSPRTQNLINVRLADGQFTCADQITPVGQDQIVPEPHRL